MKIVLFVKNAQPQKQNVDIHYVSHVGKNLNEQKKVIMKAHMNIKYVQYVDLLLMPIA